MNAGLVSTRSAKKCEEMQGNDSRSPRTMVVVKTEGSRIADSGRETRRVGVRETHCLK